MVGSGSVVSVMGSRVGRGGGVGAGGTSTASPVWASSTQVWPGVKPISWPAASRRTAGFDGSGRDHVPFTTPPSVSTHASPWPTVTASGEMGSAALLRYGTNMMTTFWGAIWTPLASTWGVLSSVRFQPPAASSHSHSTFVAASESLAPATGVAPAGSRPVDAVGEQRLRRLGALGRQRPQVARGGEEVVRRLAGAVAVVAGEAGVVAGAGPEIGGDVGRLQRLHHAVVAARPGEQRVVELGQQVDVGGARRADRARPGRRAPSGRP